MTTDRHRIFVSFTLTEFDQVKRMAGQFRLSVSETLRRLSLGHRLPDPATFAGAQAILDLMKVNGDQARLGNLLKLAIDENDGTWPPAMVARIDALVASIGSVQEQLKATAKEIHHQIHPRAAR